jgi:hypothetical protein
MIVFQDIFYFVRFYPAVMLPIDDDLRSQRTTAEAVAGLQAEV